MQKVLRKVLRAVEGAQRDAFEGIPGELFFSICAQDLANLFFPGFRWHRGELGKELLRRRVLAHNLVEMEKGQLARRAVVRAKGNLRSSPERLFQRSMQPAEAAHEVEDGDAVSDGHVERLLAPVLVDFKGQICRLDQFFTDAM